ncbi:hypothetical protein K438DRAFT_1594437, partial [Mycena galopus ATCC 62051]
FVIASLLSTRHQTPIAKKTLNPVYAAKDVTWDFPIYVSIADKLSVVELVVWDKDMLRKDYLGKAGIAVEDWFTNSRPKVWDAPGNVVRLVPISFSSILMFLFPLIVPLPIASYNGLLSPPP